VCDELLLKIAIWNQAYWFGEVHSTRKWMNPKSGLVEDKPTKTAHDIPFREIELDHLVRFMEALRPNSPLLEEIAELKKVLKYGKPVQGYRYTTSYWSKITLPKGIHRVITMCFYPEHVKEILSILEEAKTGQKSAAEAKLSGKDLFEE